MLSPEKLNDLIGKCRKNGAAGQLEMVDLYYELAKAVADTCTLSNEDEIEISTLAFGKIFNEISNNPNGIQWQPDEFNKLVQKMMIFSIIQFHRENLKIPCFNDLNTQLFRKLTNSSPGQLVLSQMVIQQVVNKLSAANRLLLYLTTNKDFDEKDIAACFRINVRAAQVLLMKARKQFIELLTRHTTQYRETVPLARTGMN